MYKQFPNDISLYREILQIEKELKKIDSKQGSWTTPNGNYKPSYKVNLWKAFKATLKFERLVSKLKQG